MTRKDDTPRSRLLRAEDRARTPELSFSHPLNPSSDVHGTVLGEAVGLTRLGVNLLRIPPGKESFAYHRHYGEEEFIYILSGRGIAEIDDEEFEVGPGDFVGFPTTPLVSHHMRNPFDEDLVYLACGERQPYEIADFPRNGRRMVRVGHKISIHRIDDSEAFPGFDKLE